MDDTCCVSQTRLFSCYRPNAADALVDETGWCAGFYCHDIARPAKDDYILQSPQRRADHYSARPFRYNFRPEPDSADEEYRIFLYRENAYSQQSVASVQSSSLFLISSI